MADDGRLRRGGGAGTPPDAVEGAEESSEEEENFDQAMRLIPSYPFPADFHLDFEGTRIEVIRHLCQRHPRGTRAIALFFPGVHGGVGPCRQPGENFDESALFATVATGLVGSHDVDVDCYRCSWPYMRPRMAYAVGGACRVLHHALQEAARGSGAGAQREFRVFFVGHSLGGAVALHAAEVVARHYGSLEGQRAGGPEHAAVAVAGLCTLNGALDVRQAQDCGNFAVFQNTRALLVCGDADEVVPPESTAQLFEALPARDKRHLALPGGTHDLFAHKEQLVSELSDFIIQGLGSSPLAGPPGGDAGASPSEEDAGSPRGCA